MVDDSNNNKQQPQQHNRNNKETTTTTTGKDIDQAKDHIDVAKLKVEKVEKDIDDDVKAAQVATEEQEEQEEDNNEIPTKKELEKDLPKTTTTTTTKKQNKLTIIPLSPTKDEYKKAGVRYNYDAEDDEREIFERQTGGNWTRQVTKIVIFRTTDDQLFLDWDEERTGKTQMGGKRQRLISHVTKYKIPEAQEDLQFDEEEEANKLVQTDREANHVVAYARRFSKKALEELLEDAKPRQCEYILVQEGAARNYNCSKKDFENFKDFDHLYTLKADPVSTVRQTE